MSKQQAVTKSDASLGVTRITRMEMKGFKSFANKVDVPFSPTFNCILGPNGSGKSNCLDSLCFVLGKSGAKSMRAEKSANLIYNGGKSKKPAKSGEVHIYFDNTSGVFPIEGSEIKISRVVKQSGSSDYRINDESCTRTQIVDLLSHAHINPDGYNIILQGDIVRLVEMSPVERRGIIEEISGINIYEEKKAKAQRELDRVEEQLREADIVLAERKTYLQELKKERDQALKFKELDEKIKRNKATVILRKQSEKQARQEELEKQIAESEKDTQGIQKSIDDLKKQVLDIKREIDEVTREVEQKGEREQVALNKEVEELKVDQAVKEQRVQQLMSELERIAERRGELEKSKKQSSEKISSLEKEIEVIDKRLEARAKDLERVDNKIAEFRKKNDLASAADVDEKIKKLESDAEAVQEEISSLRERQQTVLREKDKYEFQIQTIDEKVDKVLAAQKENKKQLTELKNLRVELGGVQTRLSQSLDRASAIVPEIQTAKGKLESRSEHLQKLKGRQASILERAAGSRAVSEILSMRSKNKSIYGTIAELGKVSDKYSLALEIAAGSRLRSIVVEDDHTAQECIRFLKQQKLGVATFLPLNKLHTRPIPAELRSLKSSGVEGLALDLISYDKKFEKAFSHALGSTLVVTDIDAARKVGIGRTRMVTLDGDTVESSGAMSGGFRNRSKGSGAGFVEQELSGQIDRLESEAADLQMVVSRLMSEQQGLTSDIDDLRAKREELEGKVLALERELHIDSADIDASQGDKEKFRNQIASLDKELDGIVSSLSEKNKLLASFKMEKAKLRDKVMALRSPQAIAELNTFQQQREKLLEEMAQIKAQKEGKRNEINNIYRPEQDNYTKIFEQQDKEKASFTAEQSSLTTALKEMKLSLKDKEKQVEAFRKQFKSLFEKRSKLESSKDKLENNIIKAEEDARKNEHKTSASRIQLASVKAELAGLAEELKDYVGIEPFKTKSAEDIAAEIKQFEKMVSDIGAVNMKALEIFEHVQSEYDSLMEKKDVLGRERGDVLVMINEIDAKKRELFMRTFEVIEKHFKQIFSRLNHKGEAFLELEDTEDPFAGGMNIRVRLSGNKFLDIRSLSGGEKTMTALAFLFAIQEYQPASFYVLDEVDAALDKKNSERLAALIRSYCDKAQYIIISHNDGVITEADTLFGVSMNEHGISTVTSLEI